MTNDVPMEPEAESQSLVQMMARMMSQMDDIRAEQASEREAMRVQIKALQENVESLQGTPATTPQSPTPPALPIPLSPTPPALPTVTVTPSSPPGQTKKKATLPDPPRFDGVRRKFPAWLLEMQNKLQTDGNAIGSARDQFSYIFSRLEDGPKSLSTAFAAAGGSDGSYDPGAYLQYLSSCYGDPNLKRRALGRLESLTQGPKESFASFLPKFERELADSGGGSWSPDVQINFLRRTLNGDLEELLLAQTSLPEDYQGFVRMLQALGTNLDNKRYRAYKKPAALRPRSPPLVKDNYKGGKPKGEDRRDPDAMDWEPTRISKAVQRQNKELVGKRAKWVDEKETARRIREKRCLRCGRDGCWISECPLLPPKRPQPHAHVKKSRPQLPKVEDLVDTDDGPSDQTETDEEELKE